MITLRAGSELRLSEVLRVVEGESVEIGADTLGLLSERRAQIERYLEGRQEPAYGFNRGFGHNVDKKVGAPFLRKLQQNLIRSHSSGVGPCAPREVIRTTMLLRVQALIQGHSGIRPELAQRLIELLNAGITPVVPCFGSVGASGDLAPLAHIALVLMGEGEAYGKDGVNVRAAAHVLRKAGIQPLELEMKEGLALINGVQFSTAYGILSVTRMERFLQTAALATALSAQVMLGSDSPFLPDFHRLRPHRGALVLSRWIWNLMQDSPLRQSHEAYTVDGEVQDPYNLRCAPQILGTCYDLIEEARSTFETEVNSVTDNPLILEEPDRAGQFTRIVSGGHFHGMPIAVKLYNLIQAAAIMGRLSNMRCARFVDEARNKGLGSDLIWSGLSNDERASSSCMMIPEYVSAALTNYIWGLTTPSHLFSISTDAGQEDHVSMSAGLAVRLWDALPRLAELLAIELAYGVQASAIRKALPFIPSKLASTDLQRPEVEQARAELSSAVTRSIGDTKFELHLEQHLHYRIPKKARFLSPPCERAIEMISRVFPPVERDRELSSQLRKLAAPVEEGSLVRAIENYLSVPV